VIRFLLFIPVLIISAIIGISIYLQPNDLKKCNGIIGQNSSCQKVDAIVAISGGDTNARTDKAIELYKSGWADKLIFSGAAVDKTGPSNAKVMQIRAENAGVPSDRIFLDESSESTHQNAVNSSGIFRSQNITSVILVTSGYHQRRADLEFSASNKVILILNSPVDGDIDWSSWWWTGPRGWTLAVTELFKITMFYMGVGR
jgi:uncharacterized SAM-binding protein YcdF (DUF218 family)